MDADAVRAYLTAAIETELLSDEHDGLFDLLGSDMAPDVARAVLAVVETLHTPCPDCDGTSIRRTSWTVHPNLNARELDCPTCGGSGQSALLAFDEMRGMEQVGWWGASDPAFVDSFEGLKSSRFRHHRDPVYRFPVAVLSPDTTETL